MNATQQYDPSGQKVDIINTPRGRALWIHGDACLIPLEIAAMAAGEDSWMADLKVACQECGELFALCELYQEVPGHCQACSNRYYASLED